MPRPTTKCKRKNCGRAFAEHGPNGECPGRPGEMFRCEVQAADRVSESFTEQELELLEWMLNGLLRGGNISLATRSPAFKTMAAKALRMKRTLLEKKEANGA